ncbi:hypothetical protein CIWKM_09_01900 [Citrobacter werkmanii NBRC 105721]|nr:hypothetical protein CIWKM_09_01900 [Citrobacter werkmanii NBRC 105721]
MEAKKEAIDLFSKYPDKNDCYIFYWKNVFLIMCLCCVFCVDFNFLENRVINDLPCL